MRRPSVATKEDEALNPDVYALSLIQVKNVARELAEAAGPGSSRAVVEDGLGQDGPTRLERARKLVGATMIRAGERLKGHPQPDAAFSG